MLAYKILLPLVLCLCVNLAYETKISIYNILDKTKKNSGNKYRRYYQRCLMDEEALKTCDYKSIINLITVHEYQLKSIVENSLTFQNVMVAVGEIQGHVSIKGLLNETP